MQAVLLSRARAHRAVLMPIYTHFQAAMPVTYGYYLLGLAHAVGRDVAALRAAAEGLRVCPLGAGAVAGTDLPIDPERTARLLGFGATTTHALDAVAVPRRAAAAARRGRRSDRDAEPAGGGPAAGGARRSSASSSSRTGWSAAARRCRRSATRSCSST